MNQGGKRTGAGRKPKFDKSSVIQIRVPDYILDSIMGAKATALTQIIVEHFNDKPQGQ